jgi:DNA-binding SARP family transcriptional activator
MSAAPTTAAARTRPRTTARSAELTLLGAFELRVEGEPFELPLNGRRVLAFLALNGHALMRSFVAGSLWLDTTDTRAAASLRSALWRLNRTHRLVEADGERLRLGGEVTVDVTAAVDQALQVVDPEKAGCPRPIELLLRGELLPDWYDDWVAVERERLRQLRVHALESLCDRLTAAARYAEATEAALEATQAEPLRESAHRALVRVHLAEGNHNEAIRQYERYRRMLADELGLDPSPQMEALVAFTSR